MAAITSGSVIIVSDAVDTAFIVSHTLEGNSTMNEYNLGSVVTLSADIKHANQHADPTGLTLKIKTPVGVTTTYTYGVDNALTRDKTGEYHLHYSPALEGRYFYRYTGTGTNAGAGEGYFDVGQSQFN